MIQRLSVLSTAVFSLSLLASCGGGNDTAEVVPSDPTDSARVTAATQTANTHPDCSPGKLGAYYWEIGDRNGARAGGPVGSGGPAATTEFSIASASKWVYGAYVVQKVGARTQDAPYLNFTSGYTELVNPLCPVGDTVASCVAGKDNQVASDVGKFRYGGGHMQQHASAVMGLGALGVSELSIEVGNTIGNTALVYVNPQLAGGMAGSAASYAAFLRRILRGELAIGAALGTQKVCTNPATCSTALGAPIPENESWNYSLGHWVEDDPVVGDHAFSSAGALGFYPWIDRTKTLYGVLSRRSDDFEANAGYNSAVCGRLIRQAWVTGVAVTSGPPTPAR